MFRHHGFRTRVGLISQPGIMCYGCPVLLMGANGKSGFGFLTSVIVVITNTWCGNGDGRYKYKSQLTWCFCQEKILKVIRKDLINKVSGEMNMFKGVEEVAGNYCFVLRRHQPEESEMRRLVQITPRCLYRLNNIIVIDELQRLRASLPMLPICIQKLS